MAQADMHDLPPIPVVDKAPVIVSTNPHGESQKPAAKSASSSESPSGHENNSGSGLKWLKEKFLGVAGKDKTGEVENIDRIKSHFTPLIQQIGRELQQFRSYQEERGKSALSDEQKKYLELFEKDETGNLMLATEKGAMLARSMIKQEMLLRRIATGEDINLKKVGIKPDEIVRTRNLRELTSVFNQTLRRWSASIENIPVINLLFGDGVTIAADGNMNVKGVRELNVEKLPPVYREYINWCQARSDVRTTVEFMFDAAEAELALIKGLGFKLKNIESVAFWRQLRMTSQESGRITPESQRQGFLTEEEKYRSMVIRELGGFTETLDPDRKLEILFKAHAETVKHFASQRLKELGQSEKEGKNFSETISYLEGRKNDAEDPVKVKRQTERYEAEKKTFEERHKKATEIRDAKQTEFDTGSTSLSALKKRKPKLVQEITALAPEVQKLQEKLENLESRVENRETEYLSERKRITEAGGNANAMEIKLREEEKKYDRDMKKLNREIKLIEDGPNQTDGLTVKSKALQDKRNELAQEIILEDQVTTLKSEIALFEADIKSFTNEIHSLEDKILEGAKPEDSKTKIELYETAIRGLGRYDKVKGELAQNRDKYNAEYFKDTSEEPILTAHFKKPISKSYARFLELYFDHKRPPSGKSAMGIFENAMAVLPEELLSDVLVTYFQLTPSRRGDLSSVLAQMDPNKISIFEMHKAIDYIYDTIDQNALTL